MGAGSPKVPRGSTVIRALLIAAVSGLAAGVLLLAVGAAGLLPPLNGPVHDGGWTNRSRAWFSYRGIHDTEFSNGAEGRYNWTGPSFRLQIDNVDRSRDHALILRIERTADGGQPRPSLAWAIDGAAAGTHQMTASAEVLSVPIPARNNATRAVVTMQISPTFRASDLDTRDLGVVIHEIGLAPAQGGFRPTWGVALSLAAAVALAVAGVLLCGLSRELDIGFASAIPIVFLWLIRQDGAFLGSFVDSLVHIGAASAVIGAACAAIVSLRPRAGGMPHWSAAVGVVLGVSILKLAFFSHPLVTIGDGIFQVHRAQFVQDGQYFFTSITPRPFFEFPYAVALFVAAKPFWSWFQSDVDHVWLLRTLSLGADALAGVVLYAAAWKAWQQRSTALLVAGLWPFARAPLEALCNANLPNVFGQGLFGVGLAGLIWSITTPRRSAAGAIAASVVLAAAFLSHFSTFSIGVPIVALVAVVLFAAGGQDGRRGAAWVLVVALISVTLSYAVYYRHFGPVYQATYDRIVSHEVVDEPGSAIAATPLVKLQRWMSGTSDDYGLPGIPLAIAAAAGLALLVKERRRDAFTLTIGSWLGAWIIFTALGILTPIQMRANLAATPAFICLGAYGLAGISRRGPILGALAVVVAIAVVGSGARLWLMCLGY